ncbi:MULTISPECIES: hypothetical protein [unclassified Moorena]|nr:MULTISPECIES: hypothetical protein [unclassified Moorena]NEO12031.1 hypothetical protein [Moorena sp. SIO3E8]NEQ01747.1 hypothetical protein [Moorena sp. SIO3F7]
MIISKHCPPSDGVDIDVGSAVDVGWAVHETGSITGIIVARHCPPSE